jgi:hypothetical protein
VSAFLRKKYQTHPSTRKSILINDLQGLTKAKIDRQHYWRFTIPELYRELERAKEAQVAGLEFGFAYRKEKPAKT